MAKCPICDQKMDLIVTSFRNKPFIDGRTYQRMCFVCAHVPQDYIQRYHPDGSVSELEGPFFDHRHLTTAEELVQQGTAATLKEAQTSVSAVGKLLREIGVRALDKLKLTRPQRETELAPDAHEPKTEKVKKPRKQRETKQVSRPPNSKW